MFKAPNNELSKTTISSDSVNNSSPEENGVTPEQMELINKDIPLDVVQQGDDTIRKYAEDNNIILNRPQEN